jgi:hypothetical protein
MKRSAETIRRRLTRHRLQGITRLEDRTVPTVLTFQQGVEGTRDGMPNGFVYAGTQDAEIQSANPDTNFGTINNISVDRQDGAGERQGLLRFDNIFGLGLNQIPIGSTINSALLTLRITSTSDVNAEMGFYRMKLPWTQDTVTSNSFLPIRGVQTNGVEAEAFPDYVVPDNQLTLNNVFLDMDVTKSLQAWATGTTNFGWLVDQTAVNGWDFATSETTNIANRPKLTVDFTPPSGAGSFRLAYSSYTIPEPDAGSSTTTVLVTRVGGLTGTVTVDYAIVAGTATAGVDFTTATGTLTFGPGVTNQTLQVEVLGDTIVEGPETFKIFLSNPTGGATIGVAETPFTIKDNDLLLSEIVANHTGIADDGYEYIEITGHPNATIPNGTYVLVANSEPTLPGGVGVAQIVVDLSGKQLGSNGLLIITPTNFKYSIPAETTRVIATQLDAVGGGISDTVTSFAIVYSPDRAIIQGVDYDVSTGAYVDATTPFINDGVLDVVPFVPDPLDPTMRVAVLLDSVGGGRGPNGRSDRIISTQRPGVRVTIPDDRNVAGEAARYLSDAFSRFETNREANSAGAWFNGELNGATVIYDLGPLGNFSSASMPPGGQITPGDVNRPRGLSFAATQVSVNETALTVTLLVNRTGDSSVAASVQYVTADGTAKAGQDFVMTTGTLNFPIGVDQQPIVIPIINDTLPEGFESFFVNLFNPSVPFSIVTPQATVTIIDDDSSVISFQDGDLIGDYTGTRDVGLYGWLANDKLGGDLTMSIDRSDDDPTISTDLDKPNQGLIRFDNIFGSGPGQVPFGSTIYSGFITFNAIDTTSASTKITLHRVFFPWDEFNATFANPGTGVTNGVTLDDVNARVAPDGFVSNPARLGLVDAQLSVDTLQAWANGAPNYGWTIQSNSTNGWDFDTSDQIVLGENIRPKLTLIYTPPSGTGAIRFADSVFRVNEDAGVATMTVQRVGASTGTQVVNWSITGGTATAADYSGPTSGTLTFGPTDLTQTITIPIVNDSLLETNETLVVTLSGAGVEFTRDTATLVIRDNDFNPANPAVLLNEFLMNPSGNDFPFEYAELVGTPGVAMGSLYLVSLRGDADVFSGNADAVIDLSAFLNGSNGYTIAQGFSGFKAPSGTTVISQARFDTDDVFQNASNSFLLIYSPQATIAEGYDFDWANTGTLSLPVGAVIVDAVGYQVPASGGTIYGGNELVQGYTPQGISRNAGDTTPFSSGWFRGTVSSPNDNLAYSSTNNTNLPVVGAALTPGGVNTSATAPLAALTTVQIDDGSSQRSMVRSITLTFSSPIDHIATDGISLTDQSNVPVSGVNVNVVGIGTSTLTLTFSGSPILGNSLADGLYRLTINGSRLFANGRTVDAKNDTTPGSTSVTDFHRLFGDADGNGSVSAIDFNAFRLAYGTGPSIFDFDGDNQTSAADFNAFRLRYGSSI